LVGLLKDHAVAASHHDATLNNGATPYTTSVDSTDVHADEALSAIIGGSDATRFPAVRSGRGCACAALREPTFAIWYDAGLAQLA